MELLSAGALTSFLIPLVVFGARAIDVSLETLRIILLARGIPVIAFFEIILWLLSLGLVVNDYTNPVFLLSYAAGFATGNYAGILLEERLAMGLCILRVITPREDAALVGALRATGYGVTVVGAEGLQGRPCTILYSVVKRCDLPHLASLIEGMDPRAFTTIEDVRSATKGTFPGSGHRSGFFGRASRTGK